MSGQKKSKFGMQLVLLTHQRELLRETNTGVLVLDTLDDKAEKIVWERTAPNRALLEMIEQKKTALLYPSDDSVALTPTSEFENYIVLDGTWQEAKKIYNQTPSLQALPAVRIQTDTKSLYTLRRNQKEEGLCTAEIAIEVLRTLKQDSLANNLHSKLVDFLE